MSFNNIDSIVLQSHLNLNSTLDFNQYVTDDGNCSNERSRVEGRQKKT